MSSARAARAHRCARAESDTSSKTRAWLREICPHQPIPVVIHHVHHHVHDTTSEVTPKHGLLLFCTDLDVAAGLPFGQGLAE